MSVKTRAQLQALPRVAASDWSDLIDSLPFSDSDGVRLFHEYYDPLGDAGNLFGGVNAGNRTMGGAGVNPIWGSHNTGFGYGVLLGTTTGYFNCAFGWSALTAVTTGAANVAVGHQALIADTTGLHNIAVGYRALYVNTSGGSNVAIGFQALNGNTTTNRNVAVGSAALAIATASDNVAIGCECFPNLTTGSYNVGMGVYAGGLMTTGHDNVLIGNSAGTTGDAYANALTTGSENVWIGSNAGSSTPTQLSNSIAIGSGAMVGASNTVVLGNDSITDTILKGTLHFGTHAGLAAETVTGYITIKDAAGNTRKLAVVS